LGESRNALWPLPSPWSVEEQAACFVVRDHNEQALAYVCFEAVNIAKLPQRR
jgi:hypothetical protein